MPQTPQPPETAGIPGKDENAPGWIKTPDLQPGVKPGAAQPSESVAGEEDPGSALDSPDKPRD